MVLPESLKTHANAGLMGIKVGVGLWVKAAGNDEEACTFRYAKPYCHRVRAG